jgi:parallel beta-helix repeat protein
MVSFSCLIMIDLIPLGLAQSGTKVSGNISLDTTWTQAGSPYTLTGSVVINNGVTLTIEEGVTVNLGLSDLQINGTLNVRGSFDHKVTFNSEYTDMRPFFGSITSYSSSCIIENAIVHTAQINCYNSIVLNNDVIDNSEISIWTGKAIISSNDLINVGIISRGITTFSGNSYICSPSELSLSVEGRILIQSGSAVIYNNTINMGNLSINFVAISIGNCPAIITDNIISNCSNNNSDCGITGSGGFYTIERNIIEYNSIGIQLSSANGLVTNNTVTDNSIGLNIIEPTKQTVNVSNNNIYGNSVSNFYLGAISNNISPSSSINIDATNNWWGTTNQTAIGTSIYDKHDNPNLGTVNFVPYLTSLNVQATPNPNMPIPTPQPTATSSPLSPTPTVPEFSWLAIIPLFFYMLSVALLLRHRKTKK